MGIPKSFEKASVLIFSMHFVLLASTCTCSSAGLAPLFPLSCPVPCLILFLGTDFMNFMLLMEKLIKLTYLVFYLTSQPVRGSDHSLLSTRLPHF